jgi:hypothetical protein
MKNAIKINTIAVLSIVMVSFVSILGISDATADEDTLTEYLYNKEMSFLIVNGEKLTTFGQKSAKSVCQDIKSAGFNIETVRNYSEEGRVETIVSCN